MKASTVLAEVVAVLTNCDEERCGPCEAGADDVLAALREAAGDGGFYVDDEGELWKASEHTTHFLAMEPTQ